MLHAISPPSCIRELEAVIGLQQRMLEFACVNSAFSDNAFEASIGPDFFNWLIGLKQIGGKSKKIANRFVQELTNYVKYPMPEKTQVLQDFIVDQAFFNQISNPTFSFSLLTSRLGAYEKAGKCLTEFYELLGIGFPPNLVGRSAGSSPFSKKEVIQGYVDANSSIEYICPCCDNFLTDSANANEQGYTLEHYFPKALYPSICLHPLNLIPMCSGCNSRKGNIDPLTPSQTPLIQVPYDEIFHPIARSVSQFAELRFQVKPSAPDGMEFVSSNSPPTLENSIHAYGIMYQIPGRWETNWRRVDLQVNNYLRRSIRRIGKQPMNEQVFNSAIEEAIVDMEGDVGFSHLCYPALSWLKWAKINKFQDLMQSFVTP